jgi:quinoprotein glucose dehydrogenase
MLYVPSNTAPYLSALTHDPKRSEMNYIARGGIGGIGKPMGLPLLKPPYGRITAIDLNTGDHAWMIPNGETPDDIKNNPALKGIDTSKFGGPNKAPLLVTKTLLFAGGGTLFRAIDKKTGAVVSEIKLPGNDTGGPMSYMMGGRQYIVVAISGRESGPELIAFALPKSGGETTPRPAAAEQ